MAVTKQKSIRTLAAVLMCVMLLSLCPATALSGDVSGVDGSINTPAHDISVMSFNILDYIGDNTYEAPSVRAPAAVATIKDYMPDIIGIQEAADAKTANGKFDWNDYLRTELGKLGYDCRQLTEESVKPSTMTIGAGLMIFWKSDRFSKLASGSAQYSDLYYTDSNNKIFHDTSRYYQYVQLKDSKYNTKLYMFNTHFSINPQSTISEDERLAAGQYFRTKEAAQLSAKMKSLSADLPCFATGDYNCSYNGSEDVDGSNREQLYKMSRGTTFISAGKVALHNSSQDYNSIIDHCFVNTDFTRVIERKTISREYGGVRVSDHRAVISYMNYIVSFSGLGTLDAKSKTLSYATTDGTVSPAFTCRTNFTYKIFDSNGAKISEPLTLSKMTHRFTVRFYDTKGVSTVSAGGVFNEISMIITKTDGSDQPAEFTATNSDSHYFAAGAFHVLLSSGKTSTSFGNTLTVYPNADATGTAATSVSSIKAGVTTRYTKIDGVIYPVYIYKVSAVAKSGAYYVDDDIGALAAGTKAAWAGSEGVIAVTVGTNGFSTIAAAAAKATAGSTVYVAPGTYNETATISKKLTLLGNNYDTSPLIRNTAWSLNTARKAESIINGQLKFSCNGNGAIDVHGFVFTGSNTYSVLHLTDNNAAWTTVLDISRNIFSGDASNMISGSQIHMNTRTAKNGKIYDNYFGPSAYGNAYSQRALTIRHPDSVSIEENYFVDFYNTWFVTSELQNLEKSAGSMRLTAAYNRFENCGSLYTHAPNIMNEDSVVDVRYLYNDFIRCGLSDTQNPIYVSLNELEGVTNHYENMSYTVFGNRFINGYGLITVSRTTNRTGDASKAHFTVQQNRVIGMQQFRENYSIRLLVYAGADDTSGIDCSKNWLFNYNYFAADQISGHATDSFLYTRLTTDATSAESIKVTGTPYYTDSALKTLSSGSAPTLSGVSAGNNSFVYDGTPKTFTVTAPSGSVISYSTDGVSYSTTAPTMTDVGSQTVYYQVEKTGYQCATGSAAFSVTPADMTDITFEDLSVPYDGTAKSLTFIGTGDSITFSYNGNNYAALPSFTMAGSYPVTVTVKRKNYNDFVKTATLTIEPLPIEGITVTGFTGLYDGMAHGVNITGLLAGDTVEYKVDDDSFETTAPTFTAVGKHAVTVRVSRPNYTFTAIADIEIRPAMISDVRVYGYHGSVQNAPKTVTLDGVRATDTVAYSINGNNYTDTAPTFDTVGTHKVWVKVSRANHADAVYMTRVVLTTEAAAPLFSLSLRRGLTESADHKSYSMYWEIDLDPTYAIDYATADIKVLDYGIKYAGDATVLDQYAKARQFGESIDALKVKTYSYAASETGLTRVYKTYSFRITGINPGKVRSAMAYVQYEYNGVIYEEFSAIDVSTTLLDGLIGGIGDTLESDDTLDD